MSWPLLAVSAPADRAPIVLVDGARDRPVAVELHLPAGHEACVPARPCPVAFISPGHGVAHDRYAFVADALASRGYLVASIQHALPSDPPLVATGDAMSARMPAWRRGAETLRFVKQALMTRYPGYDWPRLQLVGHSHGGDLSALALRETPGLASGLITLDNRRHPLPRDASVRLLSIRASDVEADPGVLPTADERAASDACVVTVAGSRHNDMHDDGPAWLRARIVAAIDRFLHERRCDS